MLSNRTFHKEGFFHWDFFNGTAPFCIKVGYYTVDITRDIPAWKRTKDLILSQGD